MSISTDARAIHWMNHVDRASPGSGARYNTHVAEEGIYDTNNMYAQVLGFGRSPAEANIACDMAL
eukprot:9441503-Karenia_brevis.AAC.1